MNQNHVQVIDIQPNDQNDNQNLQNKMQIQQEPNNGSIHQQVPQSNMNNFTRPPQFNGQLNLQQQQNFNPHAINPGALMQQSIPSFGQPPNFPSQGIGQNGFPPPAIGPQMIGHIGMPPSSSQPNLASNGQQGLGLMGMPPGMTPQMPPGMTPQIPPGMTPQMPPGMTPQMPPGMTPQMPPGMTPGMTPQVPPGMTSQMPFGMTPQMPPGMTPQIPPGMTPQMPPGMTSQGLQHMNYMNGPLSISQLPQSNFPIIPSNRNNDEENQRQKYLKELGKKDEEILELNNQLSTLKQEKQMIQKEFSNYKQNNENENYSLQELKTDIEKKKYELGQKFENQKQYIQNLERKLKEFEQNEQQIKDENINYSNQLKQLSYERQELQNKLNCQIQNQQQFNSKIISQNEEIIALKQQNQQLQQNLKLKDKEIADQKQQISILNEVKKNQNSENLIQDLQRQMADLVQKNHDLSQSNKLLQAQYDQMDNQNKNTQMNLEILENQNNIYKDRATHFESEYENLMNKLREQSQSKNSSEIMKVSQDFLQQIQTNQQKAKQEFEESLKLEKERILQRQQQERQNQKQLNNLGKQKMNELVRKAGQIQCCFVTDLFKSNDKTRKAIIKATQTCCVSIKKTTNRNSTWAAVCYGYSPDKKNEISTHQFTDNPNALSGNLQNSKQYKEFKDQPENLKGALQKMIQLNWTEKYKLAIVIPNSPCHGKQYHNPKKYSRWIFFSHEYDSNPNDKMDDIISEIIKRDIVLLVIRFNDDTKVMCNELEKIYSKLKYPQLFHTLSVKGLDQDNSDYELVLQIQKMAAFIIGTDNKMTKTKINQQVRMQNFEEGQKDMQKLKQDVVNINTDVQQELSKKQGDKQGDAPIVSVENAVDDKKQYEEAVQRIQECTDGALQALCKRGELSNFEQRVECENLFCKVYTVDLKWDVFKNKIETIEQIKFESNDFDVTAENDWQCIRTKNPFAFGMMKAVYLMKKKNNPQEIYVVKVPIEKGTYKSMKEAINDCRSHLIAKNLMKEFMIKIREKNPELPQVQYTDFLVLQENQDNFWIAERFFKGQFEKYNNNDGFICEAQTPLNSISQAFSFYTYQRGSFNYIINDIQGVGNYFTDPAINTVKGNFDETDVGADGISSYLSTLQMKKGLCEGLLKTIEVDID